MALTPVNDNLDNERTLRFECVKLVMQFGGEYDRADPIRKANALADWVAGRNLNTEE